MTLGQPTPLFSLAVTEGLGSPTGDVEFIVANKRPRNGKAENTAYLLLVRSFGTDDEIFTRERAIDVLREGGFPNRSTSLFNDLLEHDSIEIAR